MASGRSTHPLFPIEPAQEAGRRTRVRWDLGGGEPEHNIDLSVSYAGAVWQVLQRDGSKARLYLAPSGKGFALYSEEIIPEGGKFVREYMYVCVRSGRFDTLVALNYDDDFSIERFEVRLEDRKLSILR